MHSPATTRASARHERRSRDDVLDAVLERVGRGDESAFCDLYDRIRPAILALLVRRGHTADVEEHFSDALVRIWRTAPRFDPTRQTARRWITDTFSLSLASSEHRAH